MGNSESELRRVEVATVEAVLDLMRDAGKNPDDKRPGGIAPESNGYGCSFAPDVAEPERTRPLEAAEIVEMIHARDRAMHQIHGLCTPREARALCGPPGPAGPAGE